MGLREKVALAMLVSISTQIVHNHCMPHGHCNHPLKSCTKNAKSSELIRFPDVEYPSDYQAGEYNSFLSDYPVHQPKICTNKSSPQTQNYEREAKFKRKYDVSTNIKAKPEIATSFTECDPLPQPYCFRRSSFFPEVEYPLSARDTWIPTYWSRLQDVRRHSNVQKEIPSLSSMTQISNKGTDYSNSPLSSIIKALNTKKNSTLTTPISNTFPLNNVSDTSGVIGRAIDPDILIPRKDTISTIKNTDHSDINPESIIPTINISCDIVTTTNTTTNTEINGPNLFIPREGNLDDIIPKTISAINGDIPIRSSDSNKEPLDQIVATTTENTDPDLYLPEECIQNDTVPTTTQASNNDISLGPAVISKDRLDHIVTTTNPINNNIDIIKEERGHFDNVVPISTSARNVNIKSEISIFKNVPFVDSVTTENSKNSDDTIELPLFNADKNPLYKTVLGLSVSKSDPFGDMVTPTTNTRTKNDSTTGLPILNEYKGTNDNISSITTSITNCDIKPETSYLKNDLHGNIVTTAINTINGDFIPEFSTTKENKAPLNNIVSTSTTATNSETKPESPENEPLGDIITTTSKPSPGDILTSTNNDIIDEDKAPLDIVSTVAKYMCTNFTPKSYVTMNDPLGDIVTPNTNTENYNIIPEVPQLRESKAHFDNILPTAKSSANCVMQPDLCISKNVPHEGIRKSTTNKKKSVDISDMPIFRENNSPCVSNVSIKPETSILSNELFSDTVTSTTNAETCDIFPEQIVLNDDKSLLDNKVSTTISPTNTNIKSETCISKNDLLGNVVTSTTNTQTYDVIPERPVINENKTLFGNITSILSTTTSPIENDLLHDAVIPELPVLDYDKTLLERTTTSSSSGNIKPETSITKNGLLGDVVTSTTNTKTSNVIPEALNDDKSLLENLASTTSSPTNMNVKPETSISNNEPIHVVKKSNKNSNNVISELPQLPEKSLPDNTVSIVTTPINSNTMPETLIYKNDPFGNIVAAMINTKNSNVIPFNEEGLIENIVSAATNITNVDIKSKISTSKNELLRDIVPTMTNMKSSDLDPNLSTFSKDPLSLESNSTTTSPFIFNPAPPILKTPMANSTNKFNPTQNFPKKVQTCDGNITCTATEVTQTSVDTHSELFSTEEAPMSSSDMTSVASSTTNSILTTPSPLTFIRPINNIQPNHTTNDSSQSNTGIDNFTKDSAMSQNIWHIVPEYSDDWIIYADSENPCDESFKVDGIKECENSSIFNAENDDFGYIMLPTVSDYLDNSWLPLYNTENTTQDLATNGFEPVYIMVESNVNEESIPGANDTLGLIFYMDDSNSTLKYEYLDDNDDASLSCTEIPYDFVVYPEYVNDTWSGFANDSYLLYQPIYDNYDDICLLFIDTNGTIPSGNII